MADVTVLGLGAMGSALAKGLLKAQHRTIVWNRSREKAQLLAQEGALVARTLGEAVSSSSLIVICLDSYATTHALLLSDDIKARLPGRTTAVAGISGYIVEIEQHDLDVHLETRLPAEATSLRVPDGLLRPGVEYELGIATVSEAGNVSFVETSFTTAE